MLMAACAALLASCTNEEMNEGLGIDTPIQVTASVEGIMTTRADNTTDNLDNFGLSIKDGQSYTGNYAGENIKVTGNNTDGWTFSDNKTVLYKGSGQTYFAYAPYQSIEAGATSVDFTVETDQSGSEYMQASDLLYAAGSVTSPELTVNFSHKLCKLTVKLQTEAGFSGTISYEHLYLQGCLPTTSLNLTDGTLSEAKGKAIDTEMWHNEESGTYECILVPQTVKYSVVIDANVNNSPKSYVYTPANAYEFKSNNSYTLTITVKKADEPTAIEGIDVKGWDESIALEDGEIGDGYSYDASTNTYTVSSAKGLKAWAEAARGGYWRNPVNCTLAADIDMTKESWTAIRLNDGGLYTGVIEGNGHTITGLTDCLLHQNNGTVRNLTFIEPNISSSFYAGAVTSNNDGTIENCHVVGGSIESTWYQSGGIAGVHGGRRAIRACSSTATVTSNKNAGGIVGYIQGPVLACYATGSVSGSNNSGAIVGENDNGTITACYWSGDAEKGVGNGNGSADGTTKVEGNDWTAAMNTMNTALDGSGYQWVKNPDDKTGKRPLVIATE